MSIFFRVTDLYYELLCEYNDFSAHSDWSLLIFYVNLSHEFFCDAYTY